VQSLGQAAAEAGLEGDLCADLAASVSTTATDVWGAIGVAQTVGGQTLVLTAPSALVTGYEAFGTTGAIASGAVVVVPVATSAFAALALSEDNFDPGPCSTV
jgi:hypothetical protein